MTEPAGPALRGMLVGMAAGLALTLGEVGLSLLARDSPFWGLWVIATLAYVSVLGLVGAAVGLIADGRRGPVAFLGFVGGAGLALRTFPPLQEFLPARPPWAWVALSVLALVTLVALLVLTRRRGSGRGVRPGQVGLALLAQIVALAASLASYRVLRASLVPPPLPGLVGALALPFVLLGLAYGAVAAPSVGRRRLMLAAFSVAAVLSMSSLRARSVDIQASTRDAPRAGAKAGQLDRPNIILIVFDTLRARSLSCYGNPRQTSPELDRLARRAGRYSRCVAPATWTLPSHAALFTGLLFPTSPRGAAGHPVLPPAVDTLAEVLADSGYATAGIASNFVVLGGRYQLEQGFRHFEGRAAPGYRRLSEATLRNLVAHRGPFGFIEPLVEGLSPFFYAEEVSARARDWISRRRPAGQPYFLFLNYLDLHGVMRHRWGRGLPGFRDAADAAALEGRRPPTDEERRQLLSTYDRALEYLDLHLGDLLRFLSEHAEADNTWIIVTSDHGDALGEHGRVGHHPDDLHQEVLEVPLIVKYPKARPDEVGVLDDRPVQLVDVFPTVLERLGLSANESLEGRSLQGPVRDAVFAQGAGIEAVIAGHLKYVEPAGTAPRLFDLDLDPQELRDVAKDRPAESAVLRNRLSAWRASRRVVPRDEVPTEVPLPRTLGYLR